MVEKIVNSLYRAYNNEICAVERYRTPYEILISCVISLRTKDEVTYESSKRLFKKANTPFAMVKLSEEDISKIIYPAGFYKRKAKQIKKISTILIENYNGEVPSDIDKLLELPGVGRKTANLVLGLGFKIPAICVDTHVHRISNRIGLVNTKKPEETEKELEKILPEKYWIDINHLLVLHGKKICTPRVAKCDICVIEKFCKKVNI